MAPPQNSHGISATTLPSPLLRKAAILSFFPALPLCITHGALSGDIVPALGLIPLFFSASVSLFLVIRARRRAGSGKGKQRGRDPLDPDPEEVAGLLGAERDEGRDGDGDEEGDGDDERGEVEEGGGEVLTHRILVFVVDVLLAAGLMVVLVFTWIRTDLRTGRRWDRGPELAMLAAYATLPLLVNFFIHLHLAAREVVAGLAIPGLIEYTAWRAVPPDCPHCGNRLRPDSLPPIPWYETVSRPNVSFPQVKAPSISRQQLPAFKLPKFSGLKVPKWMRGRNQEYTSLFVDDEQNERDRYSDDPEGHFGDSAGSTTVVATGSAGPAPVEEVVVGKKDKKARTGSSLFGEDDGSWA